MRKRFILLIIIPLLSNCHKESVPEIYLDNIHNIEITDSIRVDNGIIIHNPVFNLETIDNFLSYLASSDRFLIVEQKDLEKTNSTDKVIISLRHDIDDDIDASIKFAYLENKYGIHATYFVLHTAKYYGETKRDYFKRNDNVIYFLKKIQDSFDQEVGWHNDLVTLQVVYGIDSKAFLKNELSWLRGNGVNLYGTTSHGSDFCHIYHYLNSYFWADVKGDTTGDYYNWEYIKKGYTTFKIEKDSLKNYNFEYEGTLMHSDYFFSDSDWPGGKRWNMSMVNLDTIQPGKKVIILLHPQHWD
jgi:hypothetical protein